MHPIIRNRAQYFLLRSVIKCVGMKRYLLRRVKETGRKYFRLTSQTSWFLVVAAVLLFDFLIIRAIVEGFDQEHPGFQAFKSAFQKGPSPDEKVDNNYQNALVKEIISASDTGTKPEKSVSEQAQVISIGGLKKMLQVESNVYHVTATGGIYDLELTVFNQSNYFIEEVTVQVDYFNIKGQLVQTESFLTTLIKPKSSKTIQIPSNDKGVKIKYRITNIQAPECRLNKLEV